MRAPARGVVRETLHVLELAQANAGGDIGEIVFAAKEIAVHAVKAGARDALQPVLLCEHGFFLVIQDERAAFDRRDVLVCA